MDWYAALGPLMIMGLFGFIFFILVDAKSVPTSDQWQDLVLPRERDAAARQPQVLRRWRHGAPHLHMKESSSPSEATIRTAAGVAAHATPMETPAASLWYSPPEHRRDQERP
jgi:hypothetical protein